MTISLWVLIFNLGSLFSYVPLRVFSTTGDVWYFLSSFWIHPLIFLFPALILVSAGLIICYSVILPPMHIHSGEIKGIKDLILICSTIILLLPDRSGFIRI